MMLAHPQMDSVICFDDPCVNTLVIENPRFFREFLLDIEQQLNGYSGKAVLSEDNVPIEIRKNAELIDNILTFRIESKSMLNRIISRLEALASDEANHFRTAQIVSDLEQYILNLSFDLPCSVFCGKIGFGNILRSVGISIPDDYDNDLERFLDYMELTRELEHDRLFIFVGLRSYFSDEELSLFFASTIAHDFKILIIDSASRNLLPLERRITIDNDLCEF